MNINWRKLALGILCVLGILLSIMLFFGFAYPDPMMKLGEALLGVCCAILLLTINGNA